GEGGQRPKRLDSPMPSAEPRHAGVVTTAQVFQQPVEDGELGCQDGQTKEQDRPARPWIRDGHDPDGQQCNTYDADGDTVDDIERGPFAQSIPLPAQP